MKKKVKQYKTLDIRININDYYASSHSYSQDGGLSRSFNMEGHISDPWVGGMGDLDWSQKNSEFSWAPIIVHMQSENSILSNKSRVGVKEKNIGVASIRKNVEVKKFKFDDDVKEYIDHPVSVYLFLPLEVLSSAEDILKTCKEAGKLGSLQLSVSVEKSQMVKKHQEQWDGTHHVFVSGLDVSKKRLELEVSEFSLSQTIIDIEPYKHFPGRVKTLSPKGKTNSHNITLMKCRFCFDTRLGHYSTIHVEGKISKVDVFIEFEEFGWFSEEFLKRDELPEKSIYGTYEYHKDQNYLVITLAYHPKDLADQIKPFLMQSDLIDSSLKVHFSGELNFDADEKGNIISYSINSQTTLEVIPEENEQDVIEKLTGIDDKISNYVHSLEERLDSVEEVIRGESRNYIKEIDAIKKQMATPNDVLSRITLKIPIVGSILRFLSR